MTQQEAVKYVHDEFDVMRGMAIKGGPLSPGMYAVFKMVFIAGMSAALGFDGDDEILGAAVKQAMREIPSHYAGRTIYPIEEPEVHMTYREYYDAAWAFSSDDDRHQAVLRNMTVAERIAWRVMNSGGDLALELPGTPSRLRSHIVAKSLQGLNLYFDTFEHEEQSEIFEEIRAIAADELSKASKKHQCNVCRQFFDWDNPTEREAHLSCVYPAEKKPCDKAPSDGR